LKAYERAPAAWASLADFHWRVRRGSALGRFSDGLVVQDGTRGLLQLSVCRASARQVASGDFDLLGPLAAACASEGIRRDTGIISWLHWPDLVTIDGRVVAKTSLSLTPPPEPGSKARVVFGVSVNCHASRPASFPSELPAVSILEALGVEIDIGLLRDKVLHALDWYFAEWERGMHKKLVERMEPTISWLGSDVRVRTADAKVLRGKAAGLDDQGSLRLERRAGTLTVTAGSVELVTAVR
jgi:BirA family transcriptional regulator, biotin operon repressor / biotin---[acetyl-CoA-carboxylase] ligase